MALTHTVGKATPNSAPLQRSEKLDRLMSTAPRPLSPHLQIYRMQLTSTLSILHRFTGIALALGAVLLVAWLIAAASGPAAFDRAQSLAGAWYGRALLFAWAFALFYHLANGIRHLFWDAGLGLDLKSVYISGWSVVVLSVVLALAAFTAGYWYLGAF
jgi:succinate dehydrogenase / fumarate reductase cytochrome b subunit